jgi:hypothetical protein
MLSFVRAAAALAAAAIVSAARPKAPLPRTSRSSCRSRGRQQRRHRTRAIAVRWVHGSAFPSSSRTRRGRRRDRLGLGRQVAARRSVLLLHVVELLTAAATQKELPYDPLDGVRSGRDGGRGPMILVVSATTPYKTPADVVERRRARSRAC